jgi:hypothetical protein
MFGCPRMHVGSYGAFSASGDYYNSVGSNTRVEPTYNVFIHRIRNKGYFSISDTTKFTFDDIQVTDGDGVYKDARYGLGVTRITGECDEGRRMIFERRYLVTVDYDAIAAGNAINIVFDAAMTRANYRCVGTNLIQGSADDINTNTQSAGQMEHSWVTGTGDFSLRFRAYIATEGMALTVGKSLSSSRTGTTNMTVYMRYVKWA